MRFLLTFFVLFSHCFAQIIPVQSFDKLASYFKDVDSSTLGVFDIDMVLIQPSEPAFQLVNIQRYATVARQIILSVPQEKRPILYTLTTMNSDSVLIDKEMPSFLHKLNERGVHTIALTASLTGSLLDIQSLERWKASHLNSVGIDFALGAPYPHPILFFQLPSYRSNHAAFTEGILFANGEKSTKGELLVAFLKTARLHPTEVIFTDDKLGNVEAVESALLAYDPSIKFVGIHYLGALNYPSKLMSESDFVARWEAVANHAQILE